MNISVEKIQHNDEFLSEECIEKNINILFSEASKILTHRKELYERYSRKNKNTDDTIVALEYYIATIATGYFAGKEPQFKVKITNDTQRNIITKILGKIFGENNNVEEFQTIIDYIKKYNDNASFFYDVAKDYITTGAGYGLLYQNENDEIVYAHSSSLNTVAIWNNDVPSRKIGLIRIFYDNDSLGNIITEIEIITEKYKKVFKDGKVQKQEERKEYNFKEEKDDYEEKMWGDIPVFAVENPDGLAIFENVISLINKYEQMILNNSNIFKYNDQAKLKVVGFSPENELMIPDKNDNKNERMIVNPLRIKEDEAILNAKVFYTDKDGDIAWVEKSIDDTASENHKKTLLDVSLMIAGVPNVTDQGFTNADNSAALEKKFFALEQVLQQADKIFSKEFLRMWEMITARINLVKGKKYDFRDIDVILIRNLPQNTQEMVTGWLKLRGLLSDKTIIDHLPYELDSETELNEIDAQNQDNIQKNIDNMKKIKTDEKNNLEKKSNNINQKYEINKKESK